MGILPEVLLLELYKNLVRVSLESEFVNISGWIGEGNNAGDDINISSSFKQDSNVSCGIT